MARVFAAVKRNRFRASLCTGIILGLLSSWACAAESVRKLGDFESSGDVGPVKLPGCAEFLPEKNQYRIQGSGANIWEKEDAFQFLWKRISGDLVFSMDVEWVGAGKNNHRKACAMVRQSLEADAPYVDVAVHGNGLLALQYRKEKGDITVSVRTPIAAPAIVKLERDGDVFTVSVAKQGDPFQPVGAIAIALPDPVYVGLAVCSHDATVSETALVSNVTLKSRVAQPNEKRVRECSLETIAIETGERKLILRQRNSFEAPNWSRDGKQFYYNSLGRIFTLPVAGGEPVPLDVGDAKMCNNDHGLSPDGKWLAISHAVNNASVISIIPSNGGAPRRVTPTGPSYWHGWSPDGNTLAFARLLKRPDGSFDIYDIYTIPAAGGSERRLTDTPGIDDGPDYTPDGKYIYWNSERTGLMKIWRMRPDASQQEPVTTDQDYADWFPHPSPDGKRLVFLSYDKSVGGHPPNQNVVLRLMPLKGGKPKVIATLFGGQGTINVPSWSPDSKYVAFVSYRYVLP